MEINNITIIVGLIFLFLVIIFRIIKLKKNFIDKIELITSLGYCVFSFLSAILIVNMINLASLTWSNELTPEMLYQFKPYIFFSWILIVVASIISFISLILEDKKPKE